jgi:arylsulfatase A-like enzyme
VNDGRKTGLTPLRNGVVKNHEVLRLRAPTLAKELSVNGYDTAYIGLWHLSGLTSDCIAVGANRQGFDYWAAGLSHNYNNSTYFRGADCETRLFWDGYDVFAQTRDAQTFLENRASTRKREERPFFVWLSWGPPHDPYGSAPERFRKLFNDTARFVLRANVPAEQESAARKDLSGYYSHCAALDESFGELLQTLERTGLADDTVVVFTSDHGDMLHSHALEHKYQPFDEASLVPLLVRAPAWLELGAPRRVMTPINQYDLAPTLIGMSGSQSSKTLDGVDYTPFLRGLVKEEPHDGAAMLERHGGNLGALDLCVVAMYDFIVAYRGIRTSRYTYVRNHTGSWLLFDNVLDPFQLRNLVGAATRGKLLASLDSQLLAELEAAGDSFDGSLASVVDVRSIRSAWSSASAIYLGAAILICALVSAFLVRLMHTRRKNQKD